MKNFFKKVWKLFVTSFALVSYLGAFGGFECGNYGFKKMIFLLIIETGIIALLIWFGDRFFHENILASLLRIFHDDYDEDAEYDF